MSTTCVVQKVSSRAIATITSPNTKIEQTGAPGQRNWRVLILRRSMSPVAIDNRMVDAHTFLEALRQWRPDL